MFLFRSSDDFVGFVLCLCLAFAAGILVGEWLFR